MPGGNNRGSCHVGIVLSRGNRLSCGLGLSVLLSGKHEVHIETMLDVTAPGNTGACKDHKTSLVEQVTLRQKELNTIYNSQQVKSLSFRVVHTVPAPLKAADTPHKNDVKIVLSLKT